MHERLLSPLVAASVVALLTSPADADTPAPVGPVFEVTQDVSGAPYPRVAGSSDGSFVVAWQDDDQQVSVGRFATDGTSTGFTATVSGPYGYGGDVGADADGGFLVAWLDEDAYVRARHVDASDTLGSELVVADEQPQYGTLAVDMNETGRFVVAWAGQDCADSPYYLCMHARLGQDDAFAGPVFRVDEHDVQYTGYGLDGALDPAGNFMMAWHDEYTYPHAIYGRVFDSAGTPTQSEFVVSPVEYYMEPDVTGLGTGGFATLWAPDGGNHLQLFDGIGDAIGAPIVFGGSDVENSHIASVGPDHFVVVWSGAFVGGKGQLFRNDGAPEGAEFAVGDASVAGPQVSGTSDSRFVVVWEGSGNVLGQVFELPQTEDHLLPGKKLVLKNRVPELPSKRRATLVILDPTIVSPEADGADDPRCLGDPAGTVKASIRFVSATSGHDTGEIDLPCENWTAIGPTPLRNYQYKDKERDDGPCGVIRIKNGKQIRANCRGETLGYDLEVGIAEGEVAAALTLGSQRYCVAFPAFKKDGSDGKTFQGKNAPAPSACPS